MEIQDWGATVPEHVLRKVEEVADRQEQRARRDLKPLPPLVPYPKSTKTQKAR